MNCPNCGAAVADRYCGHCGQKQGPRLLRTRDIARDVVEDNFSLESRLPRTLITLLFRPGRLTRDYAEGRIARYVQPLRLYVAASLLFFLVLSLVADFDLLWDRIGPRAMAAPADDYALVDLPFDSTDLSGWLYAPARAWERQEAELNALGRREGVRVLYDATIGAVPPVVFLLVPLFALFLKLLYRRHLYAEHFVFILHFHALAFLLASVALAARAQLLTLVLQIAIAVWLFVALRVAYGRVEPTERSVVTALKYVALVGAYFVALAATMVLVMFAAVMSV